MGCGKSLAMRQPATPAAEPITSGPFSLTSPEPVYAGFWRRTAAYFLDSLILFIPAIALAGLLEKHAVLMNLALLVGWWLYKAGMESSDGQATLGKKAMCIKVANLDGERISFARASGRLLSAVLFGIGYIMAAFTKRRQALHDMMASTLVVSSRATSRQIRDGSGAMPMTRRVWVVVILMLAFAVGLAILGAIAPWPTELPQHS
jgi:uncharacterized RDD family membrane protein YckC